MQALQQSAVGNLLLRYCSADDFKLIQPHCTRAIRGTRGAITIVDRDRLEEIAGDSYGEPEAEYWRLIGPFGKGKATGRFEAAQRLATAYHAGTAEPDILVPVGRGNRWKDV